VVSLGQAQSRLLKRGGRSSVVMTPESVHTHTHTKKKKSLDVVWLGWCIMCALHKYLGT
jgi:hypothetical protein